MKKLLILVMLVLVPSLSFAKTKSSTKTASKKPSIESVLNQQVEILNARIDSMLIAHSSIMVENTRCIDSMSIAHQKAIEVVKNEQKEQYSNYYNQLGNHLDRWLVILSLIWATLGVVFGAIVPFVLNKESEKKVDKKIDDFKEDIKNNTDDLKQQLRRSLQNNAAAQKERNRLFADNFAKQMEDKLNYINREIDKQYTYVNEIKAEVEAYEKQSKVNSLLSEAQNIVEDNPEEAIKLYTKVLDLDSNNDIALLWRGISYMVAKKSNEALTDLDQSLKLKPNQARAYNNIGNVYYNDNLIDLAIENYKQALKCDPQYISAHLNLTKIYLKIEINLEYASKHIDTAMLIDPDCPDVHMLKSMLYYNKSQIETNPDTKKQYKEICINERNITRQLRAMQRR